MTTEPRPGEEVGRGGISANDQREWMLRFGSPPTIEGDEGPAFAVLSHEAVAAMKARITDLEAENKRLTEHLFQRHRCDFGYDR